MEHLSIPGRSKDLVHAVISIRTGWRHEEANKRGISHFLEHAIFLGNKTHPLPDYETGKLGVELQGMTLPEHTLFFFTSSNKDFSGILGLFLSLIFHPGFEESKIEKEKKEAILGAVVHQADFTPWNLAHQWAKNLLFNWHFALSLGTKETLKPLTRKDLEAWHAKCYHEANSFLLIYGDIEEEKVLRIVEEAQIPSRKETPSPVEIFWKDKDIFIEREGMKNVETVYGFKVSQYDPTWELLKILLGNHPISKLWEEIFSKYTYTVGSSLEWVATGGGFFLYFGATSSSYVPEIERNLWELLQNPKIDEEKVVLAKKIRSLEISKMKEGGERGVLDFLSCNPLLEYRDFDEAIDKVNQTQKRQCLDLIERLFLEKQNTVRATVGPRK